MRPGPGFLIGAALWALLGLPAAIAGGGWSVVWWAHGALLGAAALASLWILAGRPEPRLTRVVDDNLPVGVWKPVRLELYHDGARPWRGRLFDHAPSPFATSAMPADIEIPADGSLRVDYRTRPRQRGIHVFEPADLLEDGPLWLWRRRLRVGDPTEVRVYPDFAAMSRYGMLAADDRRSAMGIRIRQQRGEGMEFHQLREYRQEDQVRQVDWKATARHARMISREYQIERDQQVLFVLDCGRRMHTHDGELAHFDRCLDAMMLMASAALRQGDSVGLLTFAGPRRWLAPARGGGALRRLVDGVFDLETTLEPPDFLEATQQILALQRRRALIVWLTNIREEDVDELRPALIALRRRHLTLLASLRETELDEALEAPVGDLQSAVRHASLAVHAEQRQRALELLEGCGALRVDCLPRQLPVALVNRYLEIKRAGAL